MEWLSKNSGRVRHDYYFTKIFKSILQLALCDPHDTIHRRHRE